MCINKHMQLQTCIHRYIYPYYHPYDHHIEHSRIMSYHCLQLDPGSDFCQAQVADRQQGISMAESGMLRKLPHHHGMDYSGWWWGSAKGIQMGWFPWG